MVKITLVVMILTVIGSVLDCKTGDSVHWIDGDTFKAYEKTTYSTDKGPVDSTKVITYRLLGIDACEKDTLARNFLKKHIQGGYSVNTESKVLDVFGRQLAYISDSAGNDINKMMIDSGMAMCYVRYSCSKTDIYLQAEYKARKKAIGIWKGHFLRSIKQS